MVKTAVRRAVLTVNLDVTSLTEHVLTVAKEVISVKCVSTSAVQIANMDAQLPTEQTALMANAMPASRESTVKQVFRVHYIGLQNINDMW